MDAKEVPAWPRPLRSRHAWITGAGGDIGRSSAIALSGLGATVHLVGRTEATLDETAQAISSGGAVVHACDITDMSAIHALFETERVDIVVNAAGTNIPRRIEEVTSQSFDSIMEINLRASFFVAQEAVAAMRRHGEGGSIVFISSQMGHVGGPGRAVYCASKWAVEGITRALALELAPERIRVNTVRPLLWRPQ